MSYTQTAMLYQKVIDDVIENVRSEFVDMGVDEQVLFELKYMWENKLVESKALSTHEMTPSYNSNQNEGKLTALYLSGMNNNGIPMYADKMNLYNQYYNYGMMMNMNQQHPGMFVSQECIPGEQGVRFTNGMEYPTPPTGRMEYAKGGTNPNQMMEHKEDQEIAYNDMQKHYYNYINGYNMQMPSNVKYMNNKINKNSGIDDKRDMDTGENDRRFSQFDGSITDSDMLKMTPQTLEAKEDKEPAFDGDSAECTAIKANETDELIGSDLDDIDDDAFSNPSSIVLCQYDKVTRTKNKWRFFLKDGIMNINGTDYTFTRGTGEFNWE